MNKRNSSGPAVPTWHPVGGRGSLGEAEALYELGLTDGRREERDRIRTVMRDKFEENMRRSARFALRILEEMDRLGFAAASIRMSTDGIFDFDVLVIVNMKDLISPDFLKVYETVSAIEQEMKESTFNPHARFLGIQQEEAWNEEAIIGDGYTYTLKRFAET